MSRYEEVNEMVYNGDYVLYCRFRPHESHSVWYFDDEQGDLWYREYSSELDVLSDEEAYIDDAYEIFENKECELLTWDELWLRIKGNRSVRYV